MAASSQSSQALPAHYTDDSRWQAIRAIAPCMVLAFVALTLRLASRRIRQSRLVVSDYLAITSLVLSTVSSAMVIAAVHFGLGLHIEFVPLPSVRLLMIHLFVAEIFYGIGFTFVKLSIITLYRQLFPTRLVLHGTMILTVAFIMWGVSVVLVSIFSCIPVQGFWDYIFPNYNAHTTCVNSRWFYIGSFTAAGVWSAVEIQIGVVCCCLPTIRPVISWLAPQSIKQRLSHSGPTPIINTFHRRGLQASRVQEGLNSQATTLGSEGDFDHLQSSKTEETVTIAK
ncbi:hypothetical protein F5B19DRAFT_432111 [Rostrohypoxylon terebratum]|nr:hypothetical protein F5B19DRAFT_432111 [Rostrohypoxylon terebratum]